MPEVPAPATVLASLRGIHGTAAHRIHRPGDPQGRSRGQGPGDSPREVLGRTRFRAPAPPRMLNAGGDTAVRWTGSPLAGSTRVLTHEITWPRAGARDRDRRALGIRR